MSVNSRHKAIYITAQRKAFYWYRIPDSSCVRKETVDIDILVPSMNGNRKIMQTYLEKKEVETAQPVQMNIYHSNTHRKDLSWLHFHDKPRVQERQQVKDQQFCIFIFVAYLTIPSNN